MTIVICEKRQRILDATGHVLVLGGPGSGKTTIALKKAVRLIDEGLQAGQAILFLSFSRAAVARIGEASKAEVHKAKRHQLSIQTFHSFCWELLRSHGYLVGCPKERILHIQEVLEPLRVDLGGDNNRSPGTEIATFANDILGTIVRGASYAGVSRQMYDPQGDAARRLRIALGQVSKPRSRMLPGI